MTEIATATANKLCMTNSVPRETSEAGGHRARVVPGYQLIWKQNVQISNPPGVGNKIVEGCIVSLLVLALVYSSLDSIYCSRYQALL